MKSFFNQLDSKSILRLDALGAIVSFIFLGFILVRFNSIVGMPIHVLYWLSLGALGLFSYSIIVYLSPISNWIFWVRALGVLNLIHCIITIYFLNCYWEDLKLWGIIYFIVELSLVIPWGIYEVLRKTDSSVT